jgi:vancomycin resistance protein YoaR
VSKTRKTLFIFLLIMVQSTIAISAGIAALYAMSQKSLPPDVYAGDLAIGGMGYLQAVQKLDTAYAEKFKLDSIKIETEKGTFEIPYSRINAKIDGKATLDSFSEINSLAGIPMLFNAYFGETKPVLQPVVRLNEGKLREALMELSDKLYVAPVDAEIVYKDGVIERKAETNGVSLNVTNAAQLTSKQISENPWKPVKFRRAGNYELQAVLPEVKLKDYDEIQQVLAEYTTDIMDEKLSDSIALAVDSINGIVLPATVKEEDAQAFSFVEWLMKEDTDFANDNEGYDQVASTLYAALLSAGISADSITRLPHKLAVDYIEPGLDAWISGSTGDLQFINPFGHKLAIFAQMENGRVKAVIAGDISDKKGNTKITTEITQKFEPPVYNVENKSLKPGESIVLNPGKDGIAVNVYLNGKFIKSDKYEAEKVIVQVGPGTEWKNEGK